MDRQGSSWALSTADRLACLTRVNRSSSTAATMRPSWIRQAADS